MLMPTRVLALLYLGFIAPQQAVCDPRIAIDPSHPFYPRWGDRYLLLVGASDRQALAIWQSEKGFHWRRYLREMAPHGFNYLRQDVTAWIGLASFASHPAQFTNPRWAFRRTGPGTSVDSKPRFDLTRLDEGYFQERLVPFLREAERLGLVVELTLFDDCRSRRAFRDCLYAPENNVNDLGLEPGDDPHGDGALKRSRLLSIQETYVNRVLQATKPFGNVIYEVANETGGSRWAEHFVEFIHLHLPGALVSAGEQGSTYDPVAGKCDLVVKHRGKGGLYSTDEDVARHRKSLIEFRRAGKPVLHNEFFLFANRSTDDLHFVRKMFWADFTGGGHANFFDFTWHRGTGRTMDEGIPSQPLPEEILKAGRFLRKFIDEERIPFWKMEPHDELAFRSGNGPRPFVLSRPGEIYIAYLVQGGSFQLDLKEASGSFTALWYHPSGGTFREPFELKGGGSRTFATPNGNDWALSLRRRHQ